MLSSLAICRQTFDLTSHLVKLVITGELKLKDTALRC